MCVSNTALQSWPCRSARMTRVCKKKSRSDQMGWEEVLFPCFAILVISACPPNPSSPLSMRQGCHCFCIWSKWFVGFGRRRTPSKPQASQGSQGTKRPAANKRHSNLGGDSGVRCRLPLVGCVGFWVDEPAKGDTPFWPQKNWTSNPDQVAYAAPMRLDQATLSPLSSSGSSWRMWSACLSLLREA